jgi:hypothetical protein
VIDLKPYYDAARAADDEVQRIMNLMHEHFNSGTEEGKQAALDLRSDLDAAKAKAADANQLYLSMREAAAQSSNAAREFVPVNDTTKPAGKSGVMNRKEFLALDASARMAYIKRGGILIDEDEE